MKKNYIQPHVLVSFVVVELLLQTGSGSSGNVGGGEGDNGDFCKKHDFSSWDYDFDEEDESESNFSSKSLWD